MRLGSNPTPASMAGGTSLPGLGPPSLTCGLMFRVRRLHHLLATLLGTVILGAACSTPAPEVPAGADPALEEGRTIWIGSCASCHGSTGGGGRGPALDNGRVLERFPDVEDQIALVANGKGAMPSFGGRLSEAEIEAVVRYTREVLTVAE